jgi:hypothetical protein
MGDRFCNCDNPDYEVDKFPDEELGCNYEIRECKNCGHYWEGPLYDEPI